MPLRGWRARPWRGGGAAGMGAGRRGHARPSPRSSRPAGCRRTRSAPAASASSPGTPRGSGASATRPWPSQHGQARMGAGLPRRRAPPRASGRGADGSNPVTHSKRNSNPHLRSLAEPIDLPRFSPGPEPSKSTDPERTASLPAIFGGRSTYDVIGATRRPRKTCVSGRRSNAGREVVTKEDGVARGTRSEHSLGISSWTKPTCATNRVFPSARRICSAPVPSASVA
jgi:hypothetical protein